MSFISSPPAAPGGSTTQLQRNNAGAFAGSTITDDGSTLILKPGANSTTAVQITKADGTTKLLTADTTNSQLLVPDGVVGNPGLARQGDATTGIYFAAGFVEIAIAGVNKAYFGANQSLITAGTGSLQIQNGGIQLVGTSKITQYSGVNTAGWGVPAIFAAARSAAATAAVGSVATYTCGAADGSFEVSANVLVTTATAHNFTVTCAYTDEGNTARTLTFNFSSLAGVLATAIINTGGAVPYEGVPMHIRCKASTAITIATTGTFTTVTYNVDGNIRQIA